MNVKSENGAKGKLGIDTKLASIYKSIFDRDSTKPVTWPRHGEGSQLVLFVCVFVVSKYVDKPSC